jgi:hypothetical protein
MGSPVSRDFVDQNAEGAIVFAGCDDAIVGYAERPGMERVVVYDWWKLIDVFSAQGMTINEAIEWVDCNIACLWAGERTPVLLFKEQE